MFKNVRTALVLGVLLAPATLMAQTADAPENDDAPAATAPAASGDTPAEDTAQDTAPETTDGAATPDAEGTGTKPRVVTGNELPGQLSLGEDQSGAEVGQTYVRETVKDWAVQCVRTEEGTDPCQLYQLLRDKDGNAVSEISIFALPDGGQAVAGATIITPLETLLTQQVTLTVDSGASKRYPFSWCSQIGCFARIGLTAQDLNAFRKGSEVKVNIVPVAAPDQKVELAISLSGFTAGFEAAAK